MMRNSYLMFACVSFGIYFITNFICLNTLGQKGVIFKAHNTKPQIDSIDDAYVKLTLSNNSTKIFLIPNVISKGNTLGNYPDVDIIFELYKKTENRSFTSLNPCSILDNPDIPEEGILLKKYGKGTVWMYDAQLPVNCVHIKGNYKIRYIFFLRDINGKKCKTISNWYYFEVTHDLL